MSTKKTSKKSSEKQMDIPTAPPSRPADLPSDGKFELWTWERAKEVLEKQNNDNRDMRESTVKSFMRLMETDAFDHTHQGVAFDTKNELADGQHRLAAMVRLKRSYWLQTTYGCKPAARMAMDGGTQRRVRDVVDLPQDRIARITVIIMATEGFRGRLDPFTADIANKKYRAGLDAVDHIFGKHNKGTGRAAYAAAFAFAYPSAPEPITDLMGQFMGGDGITGPIKKLRDYAMMNKATGSGAQRQREDFVRTLNVIATELDERKRVSADRADAALARFKKAYAQSK